MHTHLSGWQRIGIVASVLWAIAAWVASISLTNGETGYALDSTYKACYEDEKDALEKGGVGALWTGIRRDCSKESERSYRVANAKRFPDAASAALVPIPFGWLLGYMLKRLGRWQRVGIVASVLWAIVAGAWAWKIEIDHAVQLFVAQSRLCDEHAHVTRHDEVIGFQTLDEGQQRYILSRLPPEAKKAFLSELNEYRSCNIEATKFYGYERKLGIGDALSVAFLPIAFAWPFAYIVVKVWRWVRRGFSSAGS